MIEMTKEEWQDKYWLSYLNATYKFGLVPMFSVSVSPCYKRVRLWPYQKNRLESFLGLMR